MGIEAPKLVSPESEQNKTSRLFNQISKQFFEMNNKL